MRRRAVLEASAAVLLLGCSPGRKTGAPGLASPESDARPPTAMDPQAAPEARCPPGADRFATYAFAGQRARAVAALDVSSPDFDDALATLSKAAREPGHGLPIEFAFAASQWGWQVPLIRSTLAAAGFEPAELIYLVLEDGSPLWAWASSCDLATATAAVASAWGLSLRPTAYGAAAQAPVADDGRSTFAYDLLVWGAQFFALVPAGRGHAAAQRLGAVIHDDASMRLGDGLATSPPAPIRIALPERGLLDPTSPPAPQGGTRLRIVSGRIERAAPGLP